MKTIQNKITKTSLNLIEMCVRVTSSITIYKEISFLCPYFKIPILSLKYNYLLTF